MAVKRNENNPIRATMTVREVASELGLSLAGTYEAIRRNEVPALKFGRRICVSRRAFEAMLDARGGDKK